jgi:inward rectifier potassium channel
MTSIHPRIVPAEEEKDLGFGTVVASERAHRLLNRDGSFNVARDGLSLAESLSPYHWLLTMSWTRFFALLTALYLVANAVFAVGYILCGAGALASPPTGMPEGRFLQAFFFSVETFATIGYGNIYPVGTIPNMLMTVESIAGLMAVALATGIVFARFSRPIVRIRFSKKAIIAPYRGITAFEFRIANERNTQMVQLEAKVLLSRFEMRDGHTKREFVELALERRQVVFFPLTWTIVHPIDETSPLYGRTPEDLVRSAAEFLVLLSGYDETFATTLLTRTSYRADEVEWDARFKSPYTSPGDGGVIRIDIGKLDDIETGVGDGPHAHHHRPSVIDAPPIRWPSI